MSRPKRGWRKRKATLKARLNQAVNRKVQHDITEFRDYNPIAIYRTAHLSAYVSSGFIEKYGAYGFKPSREVSA